MFATLAQLLALALCASASASISGASGASVAVYWGQGNAQIPLSEVCSDPSVDIVNLAFVNVFPKTIGDYPGTNFGTRKHSNDYIQG
jgi:chitinase